MDDVRWWMRRPWQRGVVFKGRDPGVPRLRSWELPPDRVERILYELALRYKRALRTRQVIYLHQAEHDRRYVKRLTAHDPSLQSKQAFCLLLLELAQMHSSRRRRILYEDISQRQRFFLLGMTVYSMTTPVVSLPGNMVLPDRNAAEDEAEVTKEIDVQATEVDEVLPEMNRRKRTCRTPEVRRCIMLDEKDRLLADVGDGVPLSDVVKEGPYTSDVLSQLVSAGDLSIVKVGRTLMVVKGKKRGIRYTCVLKPPKTGRIPENLPDMMGMVQGEDVSSTDPISVEEGEGST